MALRVNPSSSYRGHSARAESRARVAIEAKIETMHGKGSAFLLNLSCGGAMVQSPQVPGRSGFVILKCGRLDVLGTVAWVHNDCFGIAFDEPVDEELVIELRRIADGISGGRISSSTRRPGLATRPLTDKERQLGLEWASAMTWA